jgi:hypothetical protein
VRQVKKNLVFGVAALGHMRHDLGWVVKRVYFDVRHVDGQGSVQVCLTELEFFVPQHADQFDHALTANNRHKAPGLPALPYLAQSTGPKKQCRKYKLGVQHHAWG